MKSLSPQEVSTLVNSVRGTEVTAPDVRRIFEACDALWLHPGDPKVPHAELTSGKCSDGFVDVLRVLRYTALCQLFATELKRLFVKRHPGSVHWVVGSDHASATLSYELARQLYVMHDFTEKMGNGFQLWKRFDVGSDEIVLQVEELVTTSGTIKAVREGIRAAHPHPIRFAPVTLSLIHRSDVYEFEGSPILYLAHFDINTWEQHDCPLCQAGSERLRPKQQWSKLTASR